MKDTPDDPKPATGEIDAGGLPRRQKREPRNRLRSLTRLALGGIAVGVEDLFRQLDEWEDVVERAKQEKAQKFPGEPALLLPPSQETITYSDEVSPEREKQIAKPAKRVKVETSSDRKRFALVGMIFESQDRLADRVEDLRKLRRVLDRVVEPLARPVEAVTSSRLMAPINRRLGRWVERGETELAGWIETGRDEEARSRTLAEVAFDKTMDQSIEYLTTNPEVQELVQSQSTSLANEVIEEVRERTVSADTFLEGLARSLLHRGPRSGLPEPPPAVRMSAPSMHSMRSPKRRLSGSDPSGERK